MERLKERHSADVHRRALGVLWIGLKARTQTAAEASEVKDVREKIKAAQDKHEEAVMARMAASAVIVYADALLGDEVRSLSRAALDLVKGDRTHATYTTLFHTAPSEAMRPIASSEQTSYVRRLLEILKLGGAHAPLDRFITPLAAAQVEVDEALAARDACYVEEAKAQAVLMMALEEARRLYNGFHPRLSTMFPEQDALVESFFADL